MHAHQQHQQTHTHARTHARTHAHHTRSPHTPSFLLDFMAERKSYADLDASIKDGRHAAQKYALGAAIRAAAEAAAGAAPGGGGSDGGGGGAHAAVRPSVTVFYILEGAAGDLAAAGAGAPCARVCGAVCLVALMATPRASAQRRGCTRLMHRPVFCPPPPLPRLPHARRRVARACVRDVPAPAAAA
jgi:hypothetical protein